MINMLGNVLVMLAVATTSFALVCPPEGRADFPDASDVTKYISCVGGLALPRNCDRGLVFNADQKRCRAEPPVCPESQLEVQLLPHESDCTKFYKCAHGTLVVFQCPVGTEYNPDRLVCDWPTAGGCSSSSTASPPTEPPSSTAEPTTAEPSVCPEGSESITIVPHPSDCSKFYVCMGSSPTEYSCSVGTEFNPDTQSCEKISENGCTASQRK